MKNLGPWIAITVLILGTVIIVLLFTELGWNRIADAPPIAASDSKLWNFTTGFELLAATALAWWPYSGGMVRLTSGGRGAMWPLVCGLAIPTALVSTIGLWSALALPETGGDPTVFLVDLGGVWVGIVSLAFIVLANIGTTMVGIYVTAVGLRQVPAIERTPWSASTAMGLVPVGIVLVVTPDWVFDNIGTFLGFMGVVFAPMCAIQAVDYFVFRRKTLNVRGLYVSGKGTPYHFWGGFNLVGLFALASGCLTYLYLLDPVKYTSRSPYEYMSASLPAAFVAAVVYAVLTKLIVIPSGRGDYPQDATAEPAGEQVLAGAASR
jgi:NCS1 family nucleobase:cation symporter-1